MPVPPITTGFLEAMPPQSAHCITFHIPDWKTCMGFKNGDPAIFQQLKSIYPRLAPFGPVKQLAGALHQKLGLPPTHGLFYWVAPDTLRIARAWATSPKRQQAALAAADLTLHVVDVAAVRLYVVAFPAARAPGIVGAWQNYGLGPSSRLALELLPHAAALTVLPFDGAAADATPPEPTFLPEGPGHVGLRARIAALLHRGALEPERLRIAPADVFLYPTGMAAIYRAHELLLRRKAGKVLVLGSVFYNSWKLFQESDDGFKHFGQVRGGDEVLDGVEAWLDAEAEAGGRVSYVFVEFPSNPLLVGVDLRRLRGLATKHDLALVIDETVGSFANIDVAPVADIILTSTTKSFSGYADVMGGSAVLVPGSPSHDGLAPLFAAHHRNEVAASDAAHLLSNSADYLTRSATLNRNAAAVVAFLAARLGDSAAVTGVLYPTQDPHTRAHVDAFLRRRGAGGDDDDGAAPGYGCLLSVDLATTAAAEAFHDALAFHGGPHLGAHRALKLPFNATVFGKDPVDAAYHAAYGMRPEQVRISVGLEPAEELVAAVAEAVEAAERAIGGGGTEEAVAKVVDGMARVAVQEVEGV